MTSQTYDRAPRLTKLVTAHMSKGAYTLKMKTAFVGGCLCVWKWLKRSLVLPAKPVCVCVCVCVFILACVLNATKSQSQIYIYTMCMYGFDLGLS